MTNPYIFPGLKQPTSELFYDIQAMIAENGGLIRLADTLENEWVKSQFRKPVRRNAPYIFNEKEIDFIKNNYHKLTSLDMSVRLNIPLHSMRSKVSMLQYLGIINYKYAH